MAADQLLPRIHANLQQVRENIQTAAAGRPVRLICVTKYANDEVVRALLQAGAGELGENLLPRAAERFSQLQSEGFRFTRHLIGAQQSRKLKLIPGHFDMLQALDRRESAVSLSALQMERGEILDVLAEINIARELQKHGFLPEAADEACDWIQAECPGLRLRGLMAVPPWPEAYGDRVEFERSTRGYFRQMRELFDRISALDRGASGLETLSLGMSLDYVWAIEEGATMVRVGSALFSGLAEG